MNERFFLRFLNRLLLTAALVAACWAPAPAQIPGMPATGRQAPAPAEAAPEEPNAALISPEETLRTFLTSFPNPEQDRPDTVATAGISALDFSEALVPPTEAQRVEAARLLKSVLDRLEYIDYGQVAREYEQQVAGGGPRDRYLVQSIPGVGPIELVRNEDGEWRFSPRTVQRLPELWSAVEDRQVLGQVEATIGLSPGQWIRSNVPDTLKQDAVILEGWQWIGILVLIVIGVAADRIFFWILTLAAIALSRRFKLEVSKEGRRGALRPFGLLAMAGVWAIGIHFLLLPSTIEAILLVAIKFIAAASFVWAAYRLVDAVQDALTRRAIQTPSRIDDLIIPFVARVSKIFVLAFGIMFVASNVGINISGLLAGLGLGGLAFALAAKDTVSNLFGSMTILFDRPFSVGDWITIENGVDGTVESVGLRSTRVRTFYNSLVSVPNSILINSYVDNYGMRRYRRWRTVLQVTYDTPPEKIDAFCEGMRELVRLHPYTRKDYYHIYANDFGAHSLDILVYVFFDAPDWGTELRERHRLFTDILRLARRLDVEFAFPTQTLHIARGVPGHENKPQNAAEAMDMGQKNARNIMRENFGPRVTKPAPVAINVPPDVVDLDEYLSERSGGNAGE